MGAGVVPSTVPHSWSLFSQQMGAVSCWGCWAGTRAVRGCILIAVLGAVLATPERLWYLRGWVCAGERVEQGQGRMTEQGDDLWLDSLTNVNPLPVCLLGLSIV